MKASICMFLVILTTAEDSLKSPKHISPKACPALKRQPATMEKMKNISLIIHGFKPQLCISQGQDFPLSLSLLLRKMFNVQVCHRDLQQDNVRRDFAHCSS